MPKTKSPKTKATPKLSAADEFKHEIRYFKGLSILLMVMLVVIFFTFSALFAAMYMETKVMQQNLSTAFNQLVEKVSTIDAAEDELYDMYDNVDPLPEDYDLDDVDVTDWLSFSKYNFQIKFPPAWTFADDPFNKTVHFFVDGQTHEVINGEVGDFYVKVSEENNYEAETPFDEIEMSDSLANAYTFMDEETLVSELVEVLEVDGLFYELHFISDDLGVFPIQVNDVYAIEDNFTVGQ